MGVKTSEGREITDESICTFNGVDCTELDKSEIDFTDPEDGCRYCGWTNGGEKIANRVCKLRDYYAEENWNVAEFHRKLNSGEIRLVDDPHELFGNNNKG